jgi:hypothetical protein
MNIKKMLVKPLVVALVADVNQGKSMALYHFIEELKDYSFSLYYYGLRIDVKHKNIKTQHIFTVAEVETVRNSLIIVDELSSLFDLDNRKSKRAIENTMRLVNHNNNVIILCGPPENFKKFLSAKINIVIAKKCTIADFINGSSIKLIVTQYNGPEKGAEVLNMPIDEALVYDGRHYETWKIPYYPEYDTKKDNVKIFQELQSKEIIKTPKFSKQKESIALKSEPKQKKNKTKGGK